MAAGGMPSRPMSVPAMGVSAMSPGGTPIASPAGVASPYRVASPVSLPAPSTWMDQTSQAQAQLRPPSPAAGFAVAAAPAAAPLSPMVAPLPAAILTPPVSTGFGGAAQASPGVVASPGLQPRQQPIICAPSSPLQVASPFKNRY